MSHAAPDAPSPIDAGALPEPLLAAVKAGAPIRDPRAVPVIGTDAHLPPVDPARLDPVALRQRFALPPDWLPEFSGDGRPVIGRPRRPASVLVPLVRRASGLQVLLTRRADHLRDHAGQISFPGGRAEPEDADAAATALREAQEEVGLDPQAVQVLGALPAYRTITAYEVTPVVGLIDELPPLRLDALEVAEAFEVPLEFLMTPAHHRRHEVEFAGERRRFLSMPWRGRGTAGVEREFFIWGATAAMLRNLYHVLGG